MEKKTWEQKIDELEAFVDKNGRFPSKHRIEEHALLNHLKYLRKLRNKGALDSVRLEKLDSLTSLRHKSDLIEDPMFWVDELSSCVSSFNIERLQEFSSVDYAQLRDLFSQLSSSNVFSEDDFKRVLSDGNSFVYVIKNFDGRIIATGSLCIFNSPFARRASIEEVVVEESYRGLGLGKQILHRLLEEASAHSPITVQMTSRPSRVAANSMYKNAGFNTKDTNFYSLKL